MKKEKAEKVERVQVAVRVRPFLDDVKKDPTSPIESIDKKRNIINVLKEYDKKTFTYDHIYPMDSNQSEIFEETSKEVH